MTEQLPIQKLSLQEYLLLKEQEFFDAAIKHTDGNVQEAAKLLKISPASWYRRRKNQRTLDPQWEKRITDWPPGS